MSEFRILDYNYAFEPTVDITATSEDPNFPVSNLRRFHRSRVWRSASVASPQRLIFDLKTTEEIDSFAILFNPIQGEGVKFTDAAVIKLQANGTNVWTSPAVNVTLSIDQDYQLVTHFFATAQSFRFWSVEITDPGNAYGYVEVPKVILSLATQLSQTPEIGFSDEFEDRSQVSETDYGHRYADVYPTRRRMEFSYGAMESADILALQDVFKRVGQVTPIAVALDPNETLFDKDRFFLYGYLKATFKAGHRFYSYFDSGLSLEEAL